jgi:hypothetical protein
MLPGLLQVRLSYGKYDCVHFYRSKNISARENLAPLTFRQTKNNHYWLKIWRGHKNFKERDIHVPFSICLDLSALVEVPKYSL